MEKQARRKEEKEQKEKVFTLCVFFALFVTAAFVTGACGVAHMRCCEA